MKKFDGNKATERHEYHDTCKARAEKALNYQQAAGQALWSMTHIRSVLPSVCSWWMFYYRDEQYACLLTPNEYREKVSVQCSKEVLIWNFGSFNKETSLHHF